MVAMGTLSWTVQVDQAAKAKAEAKEVEEKVEGAKDAMEEADEVTGGLSDKFGGLETIQKAVGQGFDKTTAKMGFLGTSMQFAKSAVVGLVGVLGGLASLTTGVLLAAFIALLAFFPDFRKGFIEGIKSGLEDVWNAAKTMANVIMSVVNTLASILGPIITPILEVLGKLNDRFNILESVGFAVGKALVFLATGFVVIKAFAALVSVVGTVIGVLSTVVSVVGTVIAVLNPLSLIIIGLIAVAATLYMAWKNNWFGIRDIVGGVVDWMSEKIQGFVDWVLGIPGKIKEAFSGIGSMIGNAIPGGGGGGGGIFSGGGFSGFGLSLPKLDTGGVVERSGTAVVHKGEVIVPAEVARNAGASGGGGGGGMTKIEVDIGGVKVGDQTMDLSKMNRADLRALAQEIANVLGNEVRNAIS